jgi:hypothetical protein
VEKGQISNLLVYVNDKLLVFKIRRRRSPLRDGSEYMVMLENYKSGVCRDGHSIEEAVELLLKELAIVRECGISNHLPH